MDQKTLNEIVSIKHQLEEMISVRGIPVVESGTLEDMLCSISRGLIQFVCVRSARGVYKSLTAFNIQIHPGSVMFREEPEYIVAGEVVKTSRTYARSVSPLTKELIQQIHPTLLGRLSGARSKSEHIAEKPSDLLVIGKEGFKITPLAGKKRLVVLPWEKLQKIKDQIPSLPFNVVQGLRGTVIYDSTIVLDEEKLKTIFRIIPFLDLTRDFRPEKAAKSRNYQVDKDINEICEVMDRLLQPVRSKKKKRATEFITLYAGNEGRYWLKGTLNFHTAISQSMASLEALIDEGAPLMNQQQKEKLSTLYRKMAAFYEE